MDGFDRLGGIVVLAATNRPDALDPALLRPGRFDSQVTVPLPNQAERAAILAVHAQDKNLAPDVDLDAVAHATPGFSGADLANLVNEGAINAVRGNRTRINGMTWTPPATGCCSDAGNLPTRCCPKSAARLLCTNRATPWSRHCASMPTRWRRSPSFRPASPSASPNNFRSRTPLVQRELP